MKKYFYTLICAMSLMLSTTSCEDFLDASSPSEATPDFVFSDPTMARAALMNAYEMWRANAYVHANGLFYDLVVCGSDSERHPEGYSSQVRHIPENLYYGGTSNFDIDSHNSNSQAWEALYSIVATCNTLCNNFEQTEGYQEMLADPTLITEMTDLYGQAVALRATAYHELIRFWGDVPHQLIPGQNAEGLTPRDQIYEYHINKLIEVESHMYRLGESATADKAMMTRNYVQGLIGRMCLYAGGYSTRRTDLGSDFYRDLDGNVITLEPLAGLDGSATSSVYARRSDYRDFYEIAETYLQACYDNPGTAHLITTDPRSTGEHGEVFGNPYQYIFQQTMNLEFSDESVYEIAETPGVQSERPYAFGRPGAGPNNNGFPCQAYGQSRFHPTYYFGDFDNNDMRRDVTCTLFGFDGNVGREMLIPFTPNNRISGGGIANNKWDENRQPNPYWTARRNSGINNPYLRMADIILMLAEVKDELGDEMTARMLLSEVHNRAFASAELADLDGFINRCGGITEAIAQERKLEFGGEGLRRYDLIRTGEFPNAILQLRAQLTEMIDGLESQGYYTFENGNTISNYVWTKRVDAGAEKGYRLMTQCTDPTDPVAFPGWRGVFNDWETYTGEDVYDDGNPPLTNVAIQGLFNHIEPGSQEALALEADGYEQTEFGIQIVNNRAEYSTYVFRGYEAGQVPIYFEPFTSDVLISSNGAITNGYGFRGAAQ